MTSRKLEDYEIGSHVLVKLPNKTVFSGTIIDCPDEVNTIIKLDKIFDDDTERCICVNPDTVTVLRRFIEEELETLPQEREYGYQLRDIGFEDTALDAWLNGDYDDSASVMITKALRLGFLVLTGENRVINPISAIATILTSLPNQISLLQKSQRVRSVDIITLSPFGMSIANIPEKDLASILGHLNEIEVSENR